MKYLELIPLLGLILLLAMAMIGTPHADDSEAEWDDYLGVDDE
jgi:hypothetical protein